MIFARAYPEHEVSARFSAPAVIMTLSARHAARRWHRCLDLADDASDHCCLRKKALANPEPSTHGPPPPKPVMALQATS